MVFVAFSIQLYCCLELGERERHPQLHFLLSQTCTVMVLHYSCVKAKGKETIIIITQRDLNFVAWKEALQFFNCFPLMNSSWVEVK